MNDKPIILIEKDLFWEDLESNQNEIVSKYFNIEIFNSCDYLKVDTFSYYPFFRGSLNLARRLGHKFEYANALRFMPIFREFLPNKSIKFTDLTDLVNSESIFPLFIRPVSPFKEFSGRVFETVLDFKTEYNFLTNNKNVDRSLICAYCSPVKISKEWRCVFVDNVYISGSQYMENGELSVSRDIPKEVEEFAKTLAKHSYFINVFNFVVDIGLVDDTLVIIEVNGFETSSFYASDLDKIYNTLFKSS